MAKKLVYDYTFDPATKQITLLDDIYPKRRLLLISNVTDNVVIYQFNDPAKSCTVSFDYDLSRTILTLDYDTTAMDEADELQIFVEVDNQSVEIDDSYIDPVSKIRVSQPENLIDTDFEYGLQSTKWETLELTKNIPTFYSRNGDQSFELVDVTCTAGSDTIIVETATAHGLQRGTPILVQGTSSFTADGGYTSLSVLTDTKFSYKAKAPQTFSGSIANTNTQIFQGSIYSGTEFKIRNINGIVSDEASQSSLTVTTEFPTDFTDGTVFALTNSFASANVEFNTDDTIVDNYGLVTKQITIGEVGVYSTDNTRNAFSNVDPYDWTPISARSIFFQTDEVSIVNGDLYFPNGHGRYTGDTTYDIFAFYYNVPLNGEEIGGLTRGRMYTGRYINDSTLRIWDTTGSSFYSNPHNNNPTGKVTLTSLPSPNGVWKHQFWAGWRTYWSTTSDYFDSATNSTLYDWNWHTTALLNVPNTSGNLVSGVNGTGRHFIASYTTQTSSVDGGGKFTRFGAVVGDLEALTLTSNQVFYIWTADGEDTHYPSVNGSSRMSLTTVSNDDIHVGVQPNPYRNTFYIQAHGFTQDASVTYNVISGTGPTGPVSGTTYLIDYVDGNRFRLKTTAGLEVDLTSHGSSGAVLSFTGIAAVDNADSVYIPNNTFQEGDAVTYSNNGGTSIGGLTSGSNYYVFRKVGDRFSFASSPALYTGVQYSFTSTAVDQVNDEIDILSHGFTTGRGVEVTWNGLGINGLKNGYIYYVRVVSANSIALFYTSADASSNTNRIDLGSTSGTITLKETYIVDLTSKPASNQVQTISGSFIGAADGNYTLASTSADKYSFTLSSSQQIKGRLLSMSVQSSFIASLNAFYYEHHGLAVGADIRYIAASSQIVGITQGNTYYAIPLDVNTFRLATSQANAEAGVFITLTENAASASSVTDTISFQGSSIVAAAVGNGTVSASAGGTVLTGEGTLFNSLFKAGDQIRISQPLAGYAAQNNTALANTSLDTIAVSGHGLGQGDAIYITGASLPNPLQTGNLYFVNPVDANTLRLHYTNTDALAGTNLISLTTTGGAAGSYAINPINAANSILVRTIDYVNSNGRLTVTEPFPEAIVNGNYYVNTQLLLRPNGFALHRPYDGGVELIPPTNPDSQMIRQTRKYFRYQSGKGIQVSFAVNFSPTTQIDSLAYDGSGVATMVTRFPHRLSAGLDVTISGAIGSNASNFNGVKTVGSVIDEYTVTLDTNVARAGRIMAGNGEYYVNAWRNSSLRCGLFDDQNGIFFEFDGDRLFCCRRSSTKQISGTVTVNFRSGNIQGLNTKFLSQVGVGTYVVIKGQTYLVTKVTSDTLMHISPSYRGVDATGVIVSITETTRVPQEQWNLDKADGTGYTGFRLDKYKIQMAYVDYSWYGAGKVRFGFKDQHGKVQYVHEFVHGNYKTEAYMRSGNIPARYEIQNLGQPTYVPALAHWGTSVIMDGRFDDDKAYVFNASGNNISVSSETSLVVQGRIETLDRYTQRFQGFDARLRRGILLDAPSSALNGVYEGVGITGAGLPAGTTARNPESFYATPYQPYMPEIRSRIDGDKNTEATRTLLLINQTPTATSGTSSAYTINLATASGVDVTRDIPLISVRLAPSVDTSTVGALGEREIINRMQLILSQVSILTTHTSEIKLILNGQLSTNEWKRVTNPSLSELIYHGANDDISGGSSIFSFRAAGDTGTTRSQQLTVQDLGDVATLGNSILGGDQPFPDGPDVLTVVATVTEDPSTITGANPYIVSGRISWSESQA